MVYTLSHSNLSIDEFLNILNSYNINLIIDVRSMPGSNKFPHFNKENLEKLINYKHLPSLEGRRQNKYKDINNFWENKSFRNYANYAHFSDDFSLGIKEIINLSKKYNIGIMCSEALWWRCHRRIITDYLIINDITVYHIFNKSKKIKASLNNNAFIFNDKIIYKRN